MSAAELLQRITTLSQGAELDWRRLREEIHDEHERATTENDRVILLATFNALMNAVERNSGFSPEDLETFRNARKTDYNLLIVRESLIGENVCVEILDAVTQREILAGRMAFDHELRKLAEANSADPSLSRAALLKVEADKKREAVGFRLGSRVRRWLGK